jgi:hypothetical protein
VEMRRQLLLLISAGLIGLCWANGHPSGQPLLKSRDGGSLTEDRGGRQTPEERQELYERYFVEVCEKQKACTSTCKEVFSRIERKEKLKLKCP